jgi:hypothetical protein
MKAEVEGGLTLESAIEMRAAEAGIDQLLGQREAGFDQYDIAEMQTVQDILGNMARLAEMGIQYSEIDQPPGPWTTLTFTIPEMVKHVERAVETAAGNNNPIISATASEMLLSYKDQRLSD